jgi:hypothetical protein
MMFRRALFVVACMLPAIGCDQSSSAVPAFSGEVDSSLPSSQRNGQDALVRLFRTVQSGAALRHVKSYEPDLDFQGTGESFFGEGIQLARWSWSQAPQGDRHFVTLEFILDEPPGDKTVSYQRTYVVNRAADRYTIRQAR